jgi:hypothetical protein
MTVRLFVAYCWMDDSAEFRRNRKGDLVRPRISLRFTCANEIIAPFSIGYTAQFGTGQFRASTKNIA